MSKKLTRRVNRPIGHKVKIPDNRPLPEPADSMVAPVVSHPVHHQHHETFQPFGPKISPFSMADISCTLPPTTRSSAIYSQSSNLSRNESRNSSRSTYCSGYDSADESETFIGLHEFGSDYGESGTSFMSWSDEIDNDTTQKLQHMYDGLERFLHDEAEFPSNVGEDLLEECLLWKEKFPYKRSAQQVEDTVESATYVELSEGTDGISYDDITLGSKCEISQEVLKERVKVHVLENLSSHLLSNIIQTLASKVSQLRTQSQETTKIKRIRNRSRSRSISPNRTIHLPVVTQKTGFNPKPQVNLTKINIDKMLEVTPVAVHETLQCFHKRANSSVLDKCFGPSSLNSESCRPTLQIQIPTWFMQPSTSKNLSIPSMQALKNRAFHSAVPTAVNYPSSADRMFSAFGSAFAGRKSPRQEAILKSLQEERQKHSAATVRNFGSNRSKHPSLTPPPYKPPWIGFTNVTLPPIDYIDQSNKDKGSGRSSSTTRNRKVSPTPLPVSVPCKVLSSLPLEVHGTGVTRLEVAKKLVERLSRQDTGSSRKVKK